MREGGWGVGACFTYSSLERRTRTKDQIGSEARDNGAIEFVKINTATETLCGVHRVVPH